VVDASDSAMADSAVRDSTVRDCAEQRPVALGNGIVAARASAVVPAQAASIDQVLINIRNLILGVAAGAALVSWSVAGLRMMFSQGDPGEVAKARSAFRAGAGGFAVVILAPLALAVLRTVVGL
jgi:Type IV secretion system pilin